MYEDIIFVVVGSILEGFNMLDLVEVIDEGL